MTIDQAKTLRIITDVFAWIPPPDITVTVGGRTSGDGKVRVALQKPDCGCMAIITSEGPEGYDRSKLYRMLDEAVQEIRDRHADEPAGFARHTKPHRN